MEVDFYNLHKLIIEGFIKDEELYLKQLALDGVSKEDIYRARLIFKHCIR